MLKYYSGALLATLFPTKTEQISQAITMPYFAIQPSTGLMDRLIRHYIGNRESRNGAALERLHKKFWSQQPPDGWYQATANRLNTLYIPTFGPMVLKAEDLLQQYSIQRVVEFGTGTGDWLAYLKTQWPTVVEFTGIDLADGQIKANQQNHPDLQFETGDLTEWVAQNKTSRSLFVTHCGVLEYLSEPTLGQLFADIRENHPESMLMLVEPIAADFDLSKEFQSRMAGAEFSYSHHYPHQLLSVGFEILQHHEYELEGFRMLSVIGVAPSHSR